MKRIILSILICTLFASPSFSKDGGSLNLSKITVPKEYGLVKESYQSPTSNKRGSKTIFHIRDIHANYEGQKNLANLLLYLIENYGLDLILVEGGITDKDFSYIRTWATLEERKKKADGLLREGVITGETYIDIATDLPLKFQGIEDKELYEENMEIYLEVEKFRPDALMIVDQTNSVVEKLKKYIYTRRLKAFDKARNDYTLEKLEMVEYMETLDEIARKEKVDLTGFINYAGLLKTARLEKRIDFDKVEKERDRLIKVLTESLAKDILSKFIVESIEFKAGNRTDAEFYTYLRDLTIENNISLKRYKNLVLYFDYIETFESLDNEVLFDEVEGIENVLADTLCKNKEQKKLFKISKDLSIMEAFLKLKLSPADFEYFKANKNEFDMEEWKIFLGRHKKRFRIKDELPLDTSVISNNLETLESFFETSFKRDDAFIRNSLKRMNKDKEDIAFLIAGGFHTKNLMNLFKENNISYLVITPKTSQKTDDALYDRILKESYETRTWDD